MREKVIILSFKITKVKVKIEFENLNDDFCLSKS